jgi:hypothetical protein
MAAESHLSSPAVAGSRTSEVTAAYAEGIVAGLVGAATIAGWFFILDAVRGKPFYTPTVLGTALFRHGIGLEAPAKLTSNFEMVMSFTWVHVLVFILIGLAASRLLWLAERNPSYGFGVVMFAVFFEFGFLFACMVFAQPVLQALTWPEVLVGNLLAAGTMTAVFWRRHPRLTISP